MNIRVLQLGGRSHLRNLAVRRFPRFPNSPECSGKRRPLGRTRYRTTESCWFLFRVLFLARNPVSSIMFRVARGEIT